MRIVTINNFQYVEVKAEAPLMVKAKVYGLITAVYGLDSSEIHPIPFKLPKTDILVSTTKPSPFTEASCIP